MTIATGREVAAHYPGTTIERRESVRQSSDAEYLLNIFSDGEHIRRLLALLKDERLAQICLNKIIEVEGQWLVPSGGSICRPNGQLSSMIPRRSAEVCWVNLLKAGRIELILVFRDDKSRATLSFDNDSFLIS